MSTSDLARLPWPFAPDERAFRYSVNVEPARRVVTTPVGQWGGDVVVLDEGYEALMEERRRVLARQPHRLRVMPHLEPACWDMVLWLLRELAASYPQTMHLHEDGADVRWRNDRLGVEAAFTVGDPAAFGEHPLAWIGCQVPDDVLIMSDRLGTLWFDAALVTWAATWSVSFDVGMRLEDIHSPVPGLNAAGVTARGIQFMRGLTTEDVYRRVNWSTSAHGSALRDTSMEAKPDWHDDRPRLLADRDFDRFQLRIEVEHLTRLPRSQCLTFNIRTYMAPFGELVAVPGWGEQLADVIEELPEDLAAYKGVGDLRADLVPWLRERAVPATAPVG